MTGPIDTPEQAVEERNISLKLKIEDMDTAEVAAIATFGLTVLMFVITVL